MKWSVYADRASGPCYIGEVSGDTEQEARHAALSRFGISEEEAEEGTLRRGIYPADDFSVIKVG